MCLTPLKVDFLQVLQLTHVRFVLFATSLMLPTI